MNRRYLNPMYKVGRIGARTCSPSTVIRPSQLQEFTRFRDGDTGDIIETILAMDADSARWILPGGVRCLLGKTDMQTLENVWRFVHENVRYQADRLGHERVKSPGALFTSGVGDCKSFSIAEGALLRALGIPFSYRFAAYGPGNFTHVYVVADTQRGQVILDAVHTKFNEEVAYFRKKDLRPMNLQAINSLGSVSLNWQPLAITTLLIFLAFNLFGK